MSSAWFHPAWSLAQVVRIQVREEATGQPLPGAMVSLRGSADTTIVARLTNDSGAVALRAPVGGQYRVTVRRMGYSPDVAILTVGDAGHADATISLSRQRVVLNPVVVESESSCRNTRTEGDRVFHLWESTRNALEINSLTESQGLVRMEIEKYDRDLDLRLIERSKRFQRKEEATRQPFAAASPSNLEADGYVRSINGVATYFAPDARTLLSDEFARSHCFSATSGRGDEANFVGLGFTPLPESSQPDVSGVLWLDSKTLALDHLTFQYANVPAPIPVKGVGGRLEFEQLPSGAWIIPRWYIRTARLAIVTHNVGTLSHPELKDTLLGFRETGATARVLEEGEQVLGEGRTLGVVGVGQTPKEIADRIGSATFDAAPCRSGNSFYGRVRDEKGDAIPQARLSVTWSAIELKTVGSRVIAGERGQTIDVEPDSRGNYSLCGLPTGAEYRFELSSGIRRLETRRITTDNVPRRIEINFTGLPVRPALSGHDFPTTLAGTVFDSTTKQLLQDAEVTISNLRARTDARGHFSLVGIPPGVDTVRIRRLGYAQYLQVAKFAGEDSMSGTFLLTRNPPVLDTVLVKGARAQPGMEAFDYRRAHGVGSYVTRDQLEKQPDRRLSEVVAALAGLQVIRLAGGDAAIANGRGPLEALSGRSNGGDAVDKRRGAASACYSQVFVDGVRVFAPGPAQTLFNINTFTPAAIEGIEYYRSTAETPAQYSSLDAGCGTLLIWTRRADSRTGK